MDRPRAERAVREFLIALGRDPDHDAVLAATPARVVEAYADELLSGYGVDVAALLAQGEAPAGRALESWVAVRQLSVHTVCPHHLLLSRGSATVAYRPGRRLFGLGTLSSLVEAFARRLALQEEIGENVVQALIDHGGASAAYCELRLVHGCLSARGARQANAEVVTTARRGEFEAAELLLALGRAEEHQS